MRLLFCLLFVSFSVYSQENQKLTFDSLRHELTNYLLGNGEIIEPLRQSFIDGESKILVIGSYNQRLQGELIDGVYNFTVVGELARTYYVIVDNNKYDILDITKREGLEKSISKLLSFCESKKYCQAIISTYIDKLIYAYYSYNKTKYVRTDPNCEEDGNGVIDTKGLP